ncbi:MAG: exodeoxyribonuclease VII large subunit [Rikenellaceae bacterium]
METPQYITLSQLQRSIQLSIAERFSSQVWVSAEISDIKVNGSGHCYLELVEKGESDGVAKAQVRGVVWRSAYAQIAARFRAASGQDLVRGLTILARVNVSYHELYGLSLQVTDIDPTYTIGEVERQRQAAIAKLKEVGAWDLNRELPLAAFSQRIAVISSSKAAGYQDFMRELAQSIYHVSITLFEATMQGAAAEESIIEAMVAIAKRREEFDAVVVIRGGGSTNDLNCFNSYRLALHFAHFPRPVIAGIGHDKDVSVVDMVAHMSLKTPTAVAGWLVERMMVLDTWLYNSTIEIQRYAVEMSRRYEVELEGYAKELVVRSEEAVNSSKRGLIEMLDELISVAESTIADRRREVEQVAQFIDGYSPKRLLEIGFTIARSTTSGEVLRSVHDAKVGDRLIIELCDGKVEAEIIKTE